MTSRVIEKMLEETRERVRLDILEKMIQNTDFPLDQILDALQIPEEKRNQYCTALASVLAQRKQQEDK